jgi:hypothetical protein
MRSQVRINRCPDRATLLRLQLVLCVGLLLAQTASGDGCDVRLLHAYNRATQYVGALHIDKPGQLRVVASDGTVYTAGEVLWLKGQLRGIAKDCSAGLNEAAASHLKSHQAHLAD